jgi:sec-independent protein translocase protein TatA
MLRNLSPAHIMIIAIALVVLFGWKKLPDMARSLGRSARVFKSEVDEMRNDGRSTAATVPTTTDVESMDQAQRDAEAKLAEAEARLAQARSDAERLRGDSRL